jgi:predicted DNA-binding protein with PD1-like motif
MEYQSGRIGRVLVARFEDGEDILKGLTDIVRKEDIKSAVFNLIGGIKKGRVVVGPEKEEFPPKPIWREIQESNEVLGIGTVFWEGDQPKVHLHGTFGKRDRIHVGCLRDVSETFLVLEAIIFEIADVTARREYDDKSGLVLLKLA